MKIGFCFDDRGFKNIDLRKPNEGNNGIGGTEYCFVMLADTLLKCSSSYQITFYHFNENKLPEGIASVIVSDYNEIPRKSAESGDEVLVFVASTIKHLTEINKTNISCIAWAHNYIFSDDLKLLVNNSAVKRVVFISSEQYDRYIDHDVIEKATCIFNMYDGKRFAQREHPSMPIVTYTGALIYAKGFHVLAGVWKAILKKVPNAKLYVIGSGKLYNYYEQLGKLGIAEEHYEKLLCRYLSENGNIIPSVVFLSKNGVASATEKIDIYNKTAVGVVNPSGRTEVCSISVIEMNAFGIPVISSVKSSMFDLIKNKETGYLTRSTGQLKRRIVKLLKEENLNQSMGASAKQHIEELLAPEIIIKQWVSLFDDVLQNTPAVYLSPSTRFTFRFKWMRIIIRFLRKHHIPSIPLINIECAVARILRR